MSVDPLGGILRSGSSGSFAYNVKQGYGNMPVVFVSALDAARFANWLNNGQGNASTETGAYNLTLDGLMAARNPNANVWIPTLNEWYKAAYYQPFGAGGGVDDYWTFPTASNGPVSAMTPNSTNSNSANFGAISPSPGVPMGTNYLNEVGAYALADSFYGTFDQAGNVWEWNWIDGTTSKGLRGGSWDNDDHAFRSTTSNTLSGAAEDARYGFRVAAVPEPSSVAAGLGGVILLLCRRR
jgi:sulfatase modifying factor 1